MGGGGESWEGAAKGRPSREARSTGGHPVRPALWPCPLAPEPLPVPPRQQGLLGAWGQRQGPHACRLLPWMSSGSEPTLDGGVTGSRSSPLLH